MERSAVEEGEGSLSEELGRTESLGASEHEIGFFGDLSDAEEEAPDRRKKTEAREEAIETSTDVEGQDSTRKKTQLEGRSITIDFAGTPESPPTPNPTTSSPVQTKESKEQRSLARSLPGEKYLTLSPVRRLGRFTELSIKWQDEIDKDSWGSSVPLDASSLRTREIYLSRSKFKDVNLGNPVYLGH